jgi:hypothetical protein
MCILSIEDEKAIGILRELLIQPPDAGARYEWLRNQGSYLRNLWIKEIEDEFFALKAALIYLAFRGALRWQAFVPAGAGETF